MTAKEIAKKATVEVIDWTPNGRVYQFTTEQLQEYADALCKDQRSACLEAYEDDWKSESILTAPQPEGI